MATAPETFRLPDLFDWLVERDALANYNQRLNATFAEFESIGPKSELVGGVVSDFHRHRRHVERVLGAIDSNVFTTKATILKSLLDEHKDPWMPVPQYDDRRYTDGTANSEGRCGVWYQVHAQGRAAFVVVACMVSFNDAPVEPTEGDRVAVDLCLLNDAYVTIMTLAGNVYRQMTRFDIPDDADYFVPRIATSLAGLSW